MNRFRTAFAGLLLVALAMSFFAGWGLVDRSNFLLASSAGPAVTTTSSATEAYSTATGSVSAQTTTATATASGGTSTVTESASSTSTTVTATSATTVATTTEGPGVEAVGGATTSVTTSENEGSFGALSNSAAGYTQGESLLREVQTASILLSPVCWIVLGGMWMWRGRVRARYSEMGFGSDVFELFMKMKGGATRIRVLNTLSTPKDRLQLAEELGIDWKAADRHVQILNKYGFVSEQAAYGTVRLYQVTPMGKMLLDLFNDLEKTDGQAAVATSSAVPGDEGQRHG